LNEESLMLAGDQWIDVFDVSTNILSRVACSAHVCFGHEWSTLRIDEIRSWDTIGDGWPSRFGGRVNSFVVNKDRTFSDEMLVVIA